jgi:hypothetical protein
MSGGGLGQADQDARPAVLQQRAGGGDVPTHGLDETLCNGRAETRALVAFPPAAAGRRLQPTELLEYPLDVGLRYARAFVLDRDHHIAAVLLGRDLNARAIGTVGDGVLQGVDGRLFQKAPAGLHLGKFGREVAGLHSALHPPRDPVDRRAHPGWRAAPFERVFSAPLPAGSYPASHPRSGSAIRPPRGCWAGDRCARPPSVSCHSRSARWLSSSPSIAGY